MLMKGDLVRIPQNTHATILSSNSWRLHITKKPQLAIVLDVNDSKCTVLFNEEEWVVKSKDLQLYGGSGVCKAS